MYMYTHGSNFDGNFMNDNIYLRYTSVKSPIVVLLRLRNGESVNLIFRRVKRRIRSGHIYIYLYTYIYVRGTHIRAINSQSIYLPRYRAPHV